MLLKHFLNLAEKNARNGSQNAGSNDASSAWRADENNSELKLIMEKRIKKILFYVLDKLFFLLYN